MNGTDLVKEIDFDVLTGKPNGQILRMRGRRFEGITIWEEYEQTNRQHLNISDIIELLAAVPSIIRKYISDIILSPFEYPYLSESEQIIGGAEKGPNASVCFIPKYIIIYPRPDTNSEMMKLFRDAFILWHEAAHLMDREMTIHSEAKYYSNDSEWLKCIEDDYNFNIESSVDASYYVCRAAERELKRGVNGKICAQQEDFAVSVVWYLENGEDHNILLYNFPNRYEALVRLLGNI